MLIERKALETFLPALAGLGQPELCEHAAALGFPVDGQEAVDGTVVLDIDVTANRGDVMSHQGFARDLGAKLGAALAPFALPAIEEGPARVEVLLEAEACPLYATALLTLGAGATPEPARTFLTHMGAPAKGLPAVDASNELLHLYGHPTHAFDADKLRGAIRIRYARAGEKLVTLDGVERTLSPEDLLIADEAGPIALAGVMGGDPTKVTETTRRVLLESAYFDPRTVRLMARRHNLHSDASHRFGRGADPRMPRVARDLLVARLQAWAGATLEGAWAAGSEPAPAAPIAVANDLLERIAGEPIPPGEASEALRALGCGVEASAAALLVTPPSWRHDLAIPEDIVEEVLRLRGYARIASTLPPLDAPPRTALTAYGFRSRLATRLAHAGFHQTVTYGFVSPESEAGFALNAEGRTLANPLGREYSVLRGALLPSLREVAGANQRRGAKEIRLFEIATVFEASPDGPVESMRLAFVWGGVRGGEDFLTPARPIQPADLAGVAKDLGFPPEAIEVRALEGGLYGVEAPLEVLAWPSERCIPAFAPFSRHPVVERDLSLLVPMDLAYRSLREAVVKALPGTGVLRRADCVDVFRHKSLPEGRQAWLLRFAFQADRTLTGEEVDGWMEAALAAARSLGAALRT
ncbi:MAG: phenylalanine--tRNA ligase subunit beta [Holophagaceae bacterium]|nr:phenylalanine--tRNA ligase subunit beta [Holophagaceae bacterium]